MVLAGFKFGMLFVMVLVVLVNSKGSWYRLKRTYRLGYVKIVRQQGKGYDAEKE